MRKQRLEEKKRDAEMIKRFKSLQASINGLVSNKHKTSKIKVADIEDDAKI